jgi:hypothetical protein
LRVLKWTSGYGAWSEKWSDCETPGIDTGMLCRDSGSFTRTKRTVK